MAHPSFFASFGSDPRRVWDPGELLALADEQPRTAGVEPGSRWSYSNSNYIALGLVVEAAGGAALPHLLRSRIADRLGLGATLLPRSELDMASVVRGYMPGDNPFLPSSETLVDVTGLDPSWAWAAGAMVSSGPDLAAFYGALLRGELLAPNMLRSMLETVACDWTECDAYGLGIERFQTLLGVPSPCGAAWGHAGFSGWTTVALTSGDGRGQSVVMISTLAVRESVTKRVAALAWDLLCRDPGRSPG